MITKLLFTAAIILGAYFVLKSRKAPPASVQRQIQPSSSGFGLNSKKARWLVYGFLGLMILGSGFFIYLEWQEQYRVVSVNVVNSRTGETTTYQAHRADVDVEQRSFRTLDGITVNVADVERIETGPEASDRADRP